MKNRLPIRFSYQHSLVDNAVIKKHVASLAPERERMHVALSQGYETVYASLNLPFDTTMHETIDVLIDRIKKTMNLRVCIIIGIGGSHLGAYALHQALYGLPYDEPDPKACKIYYVDVLNVEWMHILCGVIERELEYDDDAVLINLISKSGSTLESVVNFSVLVDMLQYRNPKVWQDYVVVTTDKDSPLWQYAQDNKITTLEIPALVGGRFSVFSPVGLFPLNMLDMYTRTICEGARDAVEETLKHNPLESMAALSAAVLYEQYLRGIRIHDTFLVSPELEGLGKWYRQLCAESLGKTNKAGEPVGITPTVSISSTDLHSVGQLYLGGPVDRVTSFVHMYYDDHFETDKDNAIFKYVGTDGAGKTYSDMLNAIAEGTHEAYAQAGRPFMLITLPDFSGYTIANFMQYKMMEIMYLGYLLQVNPFDQPHVEQFKEKTRALLRLSDI
jgi:glucose-6-phosphate isomerase